MTAILLLCLPLPFLIVLSFVYSGSEVAFFSLTKLDIQTIEKQSSPVNKRVLMIVDNSQQLLATLLVANSFVNICIVVTLDLLFDHFVPTTPNTPLAMVIYFSCKVIGVSAFLLLIGEIMPKVLATQNNIKFSKNVSVIIKLTEWLVYPITFLLLKLSAKFGKIVNKKKPVEDAMTSDNVLKLIDFAGSEVNEKEKKIITEIINFNKIVVKDILKLRSEVHFLNDQLTNEDVMFYLETAIYSRMPVYHGNIDNIIGIINMLDLLSFKNNSHVNNQIKWQSFLMPAYFVAENKPVDMLLKDFQEYRKQMAVVVDEFGCTVGIVCLEDIIGKVIGSIIYDEVNQNEKRYRKISAKVYIFSARATLGNICHIMSLSESIFQNNNKLSTSIAGLLLNITNGSIPQEGDSFNVGPLIIEVLDADKMKIKQVRITYMN